MRLSIIVPAHNEEHRIGRMLDAYLPYFTAKYGNAVEFLVVVNGSSDGTENVVASYAGRFPALRCLVEPQRIGKGGALMLGFGAAQGELVGFADADGATPPAAFDDLVANIGQVDAVIASRWRRGAQVSPRQPLERRIASRLFNGLTRLLFGLRLTDTQCGAKLMRREAVQAILPHLGTTRWAFDVDLLFQLRRAGFRVVEIPTVWHDVEGSKVDVARASTEMMLALTRLRLLYSPFRWVVTLYNRTLAPWIHPPSGEEDHLLTHSVIMMVGAQLGGLLNMLFQLVMVRMLTADRYGDLAAMLGILLVLGMPLGALSGAFTHFTARFAAAQTPRRIVGLSKAVARDLAFPSLAILIAVAVGHRGLQGFLSLATPWPIVITAMGAVAVLYGVIPGGLLLGLQAFEWSALIGMVGPLIRLAVGIVLVGVGLAASGALMGHLVGILAGVVLSAWVSLRVVRRQEGRPLSGGGGWAGLSGLLGQAACERPTGFYSYLLWFGLASAGYGVLSSADVILAKHYFSREQAGSFAKAVMVARIVFFLPQPIAAALFPKVTSEGDASRESARLLLKGLALAVAVLAVAGGICFAFPGWLLGVVARTHDPALEPVVRGMVLALAPLAVVLLLLNYELAQRRFAVTLPILLCAAGYVLAVVRWHETPMQIVTVLAVCSALCLGATLVCLPWRQLRGSKG